MTAHVKDGRIATSHPWLLPASSRRTFAPPPHVSCIERLFRRLKRVRRVHVRYDKLGVIHLSFVYLAPIDDALRSA